MGFGSSRLQAISGYSLMSIRLTVSPFCKKLTPIGTSKRQTFPAITERTPEPCFSKGSALKVFSFWSYQYLQRMNSFLSAFLLLKSFTSFPLTRFLKISFAPRSFLINGKTKRLKLTTVETGKPGREKTNFPPFSRKTRVFRA